MSNSIKITFPDSKTKSFPFGITSLEIAKSISNSLAKKVLVSSFNDNLIDVSTKLTTDGKIKFFSWEDEEGKSTFWHSSAHILAESVETIYPGVKFGIGPPISNGFYYDIDFGDNDISEIDLAKIEKKFNQLCLENLTFVRSEVSKKNAINYFKDKGDEYKIELINDWNSKVNLKLDKIQCQKRIVDVLYEMNKYYLD